MAKEDWNFALATDRQDLPWDCSATSLAWCLRSVGYTLSEQDVIDGLGPGRISPQYGLLDASGAGIVDYCAEIGVGAENSSSASWRDLTSAAGFQPMLIGGRRWCHWVAVRMGGDCYGRPDLDMLALMNPAPGYMGVDQVLEELAFERLGPFSAVWFTSW
jgi:hypothetical protein